ncbi:MAG: serine/threonine-protein kinase [Phycisphaerales bacterium]|jgi:serine/threonine protein kinase|nr:serine/threonine-protein kinase [Phycisphaerales bacterium]
MSDRERNIPKEIGGYQTINILGEGGMSVVYLALQDHPRRKVAIKVLRGGVFSPTASRRFHLEVEILGKLDHPWIAKVFDAGTHDDGNGATPYFVMEHVTGARELSSFLEEEKLERREVLKLFAMISSAIEHGHHRGVVHRDLKPGNILIDGNGEPKIIDFGVARSIDSNTVGEEAMTEAGRLVGTVQFMAPEQVDPKVKDIDARCDVYALGVVLYQMLTARLPRTLEGLPIYEAVRQICEEDPVRPTVYDKTIDPNLEAIIMKAIQNDREKRYQSAGGMGRDMLRYLGHRPIKARKVHAFDRAKLFVFRHKKPLLVSSMVTILVATIVGVFLYIQDVEVAEIERLEEEISELRTSKDTTNLPPPSPADPQPVVPRFTLPVDARGVVISGDGSVLAAVDNDDFFVWNIDGKHVQVPPMNIDPTYAKLSLSSDGETLGVVADSKCRIANLNIAGDQNPYVSSRFSRPLAAAVTTAVDSSRIAIAGDNMTLEVLEDGEKIKRVASETGQYLQVLLPHSDQVVAATSRWVFVWNNTFPTNPEKFAGVQNPIALGILGESPVVFGSNGEVAMIQNGHPVLRNVEIPDIARFASFSPSGKHLACIVGNKVFRCDLRKKTSDFVYELVSQVAGISINNDGAIVCWTEVGDVFVFEE